MRLKNKDIAEKLGISTTAVSFALNNRPGVSEETRRKVLELMSESVNSVMQDLGGTETDPDRRSVLLSVHKKTGAIINDKPFFSDLIEAVQQELLKRSFNMILSHCIPGQDLPQYMQYIRSLPVSGVIVLATEMGEEDLSLYEGLGIPMVLMDACFELSDTDSVSLDNQTSVYKVLRYAKEMGHQNIGYLQSGVWISNFGHRLDGFYKGIRRLGLEDSSHPVIPLPPDIQKAGEAMGAFLDHLPEGFVMPTLFLADLDYIALGAMTALKAHGYRIPEDISLVGYDDVSAAVLVEPQLTTVRVNRMDIGRYAVDILLGKLASPPGCHVNLQVSSELVIRDSVKKLQ